MVAACLRRTDRLAADGPRGRRAGAAPGRSPVCRARSAAALLMRPSRVGFGLATLTTLGVSLLRGQCPDGSPPPCARAATRALAAHSVAILYLQASAHDSNDAAIADGLTEELIARLSQVPGLRVASRYASLSYRGRRAADPRQVGRALGVRYVLDGTLRRSAQGMRVVLLITDATAGFNVWGRTYERPLDEIFSVEDSVAVQVAEVVLGRLS